MRSGDLVILGREASVQFDGDRALRMRITKVEEWVTYDGWAWITGYALNDHGEAREKRTVFVQRAGVKLISRRGRSY